MLPFAFFGLQINHIDVRQPVLLNEHLVVQRLIFSVGGGEHADAGGHVARAVHQRLELEEPEGDFGGWLYTDLRALGSYSTVSFGV